MNPITRFFYRVSEESFKKHPPEELWRLLLTGEDPALRKGRHFFKRIPDNPRCQLCNAPFHGLGSPLMRIMGRSPSKLNPRFCGICLETSPVGGTEIELTMLFADVRGSTSLAEGMRPAQFGGLINRFFGAATQVLVETNAMIDRLVGDQVIALYLPAFAGEQHARVAVEGARELLRATGHTDPNGPWIPVGVGVHTGVAFVGKVGQEEVNDITVLGDAPNVAARLSSLARQGEILVSDMAFTAACLETGEMVARQVELKGRRKPVKIWSSTLSLN